MVPKSSKILVLGGSGFLGKEILKSLFEGGYTNITVLSRHYFFSDIPGISFITGFDILRPETFCDAVAQNEVIINATGCVSFLQKDAFRWKRDMDYLEKIESNNSRYWGRIF